MAATGQRHVGDYRDDQEQYLALLGAGAEFARTHPLTLGTALTDHQMRQLTTDLVWLVAQDVRLPDGSTERVLVPQVYVRVHEGDLKTDGTLMAGGAVRLQLQGDLSNSGTIAGRAITDIRARNIGNAGRIGSDDLTSLTAREDIKSSGAIDGQRVGLAAERDVLIESTTSSSSSKNASRTALDRVATVGAGQLLQVTAGRDITLTGAQLTSDGSLKLDAKRDLNLATVNVAESLNLTWDAKNRLATSHSAETGTSIKAQGDITLLAGQDLNARAAYVATDRNGVSTITAGAGRDITITNGLATSASEEDRYVEKNSNGFGPSGSLISRHTSSSRSTTTHSASSTEQVQGSTFSADAVTMSAGRDLMVKGSNVTASNDLTLTAGRDLTLASAEQTNSSEQSKDEQRRGFGAMGGISNGSKRVEQANTSTSTTQVGSSVGSLQGNVSLTAGNDYRQTASDVRALQGDVSISGASVTIDAANNTSQSTQELRMRQSGVSVTFSSPVVNALQNVVATADAAGQTKDERTQALAAANTAMAVSNLASTVSNASALNINLSVGSSRSQSHSEQSASMAATSSVAAGGNLTISATGQTPGQGNLTAIGANLSAGGNASLSATNDIDLRAAQNTATQRSSNSSSSASVGIGFALGGTQNGFTINAAASQARGNADGSDVTNTLTTVTAGNNLTLNSGRDTNLIGAVASGNQVTANVGRNLDLQSVQDTSTYTSKESSAGVGVSLCVYPICYGTSSASVSASRGNVNGNFASVATQSGIKAGDGGFNVNVAGNTNLTAAAITSSQSAVDAGKNSLATSTLTQSEIRNNDNYSASSLAASASYTSAATEYNPDTDQAQTARNRDGSLSQASTGQGLGVGRASGSQGSTTTSAISGASVTIKSGDNTALAAIDRTAVTETAGANALTRTWNGQQLQQDVRTQAQVMQSFSQVAPKAVADFAQGRINSLNEQARMASEAGDTARAQELKDEAGKWAEGGIYRVAAHAAVGGLSGGVDGALGAGVAAQAAPLLDRMQTSVQARLQDAGMSPDAAKDVATVVGTGTATALGAAVGGGNAMSMAMAFNVDANNRQLHPSEIQWIARNARGYAQQQCGCTNPSADQIASAEQSLAQQAYRQVQFGAEGQWDATAQAFLNTAPKTLLPSDPNFASTGPGFMFYATPEQRANSAMYLNTLATNAGFYANNGLKLPTIEQIVEGASRDSQGRQLLRERTISAAFVAGALVLSPATAGLTTEVAAFTQNPVTYCLANPAGCTVAAETIACVAAGPACPASSMVPNVASAGRPAATIANNVQHDGAAVDTARLATLAANARTTLPSSIRNSGNVAAAEINVPGLPATMLASSRIDNPTAAQQATGFVGRVEGQFETQAIPIGNGQPIDRVADSEAKILSTIGQQLGNNTQARGMINLYTERAPCASCESVIEQFRARYPNIVVNVVYRDPAGLPSKHP
jgi:filamentous hemagglutinin